MTESCQDSPPSRLGVYIDGFNLYHAIVDLGDPVLKWLNMRALAESFVGIGEGLVATHFFTAVTRWDKAKQQRHTNFLKAQRAVGVIVHEGNFKQSRRICHDTGRNCRFHEEKQTDVAIAVRMVTDVLTDKIDRAVLITADSDQLPVARLFAQMPNKRLTLAYPPNRKSFARDLGNAIPDRVEISEGRLRTCRLPPTVVDAKGRGVAFMPAIYRETEFVNAC